MPSKDISYQVALKLSFCSAATLSEVLGMWPRPFRKLLGREHLSPGITTFPQKAGSHFAHQKMQGLDRRKYHGWWVKHFLVGVQCDYGNGNLYSAFYWMLKPLSKSSYSLLLEHVSAQRSWDLTEALSLSLCKSLSFGETVEGWRRRGWSSASRKYGSRSFLKHWHPILGCIETLAEIQSKMVAEAPLMESDNGQFLLAIRYTIYTSWSMSALHQGLGSYTRLGPVRHFHHHWDL